MVDICQHITNALILFLVDKPLKNAQLAHLAEDEEEEEQQHKSRPIAGPRPPERRNCLGFILTPICRALGASSFVKPR